MIVTQAIRNDSNDTSTKNIDHLYIEWFQTSKRIQRLKTEAGMDIAIRFMGKEQCLQHGDIVYEDAATIVRVSILPTDCIVLNIEDIITFALVCYEIGNKHMPLFIFDNQLLMPYERAIFNWLESSGYTPKVEQRQLLQMLNANINPLQHKSVSFTLPKLTLSIKE